MVKDTVDLIHKYFEMIDLLYVLHRVIQNKLQAMIQTMPEDNEMEIIFKSGAYSRIPPQYHTCSIWTKSNQIVF